MKNVISVFGLIFFGINLLCGQFSVQELPSGTIINDLDVDENNNLLVATDVGLQIFDGSNWVTYDTSNGLPDNDVKCISTSQGNVYVGTANHGLVYLSNSTWVDYSLNTTTSYDYISYIFAKQNGDKYFGTDNGRVFELLSGQSNPTLKNYGSLGRITCVEETSNGVVRAALSTNGIMLDFSGYLVPINTNSSPLPSNNVICGIMNNNYAYDGTDAGLYLVNFNVGPPYPYYQPRLVI